VEGAVAAADQGKQLLAVEVSAIWHLGPIVLDVRIIFNEHDEVIKSENSGKYNIDLGEYKQRGDHRIGEWFIKSRLGDAFQAAQRPVRRIQVPHLKSRYDT
jgi:hypothetical protein